MAYIAMVYDGRRDKRRMRRRCFIVAVRCSNTYFVMAHIVMAYVVMAHIVMGPYSYGPYSYGPYNYGSYSDGLYSYGAPRRDSTCTLDPRS